VNEARSADLVVIPRTQVKINPYRFLDAAAAVLSMGRPTILVPEHVSELKAERILWVGRIQEKRVSQFATHCHFSPVLQR